MTSEQAWQIVRELKDELVMRKDDRATGWEGSYWEVSALCARDEQPSWVEVIRLEKTLPAARHYRRYTPQRLLELFGPAPVKSAKPDAWALCQQLRPGWELLTAGTIWRIPGEVSVDVHVLAVVRREVCHAEVRYRFRGDTGRVNIANAAHCCHWTYVGELVACGAASESGQLLCERSAGHDGEHWHQHCGSWSNRVVTALNRTCLQGLREHDMRLPTPEEIQGLYAAEQVLLKHTDEGANHPAVRYLRAILPPIMQNRVLELTMAHDSDGCHCCLGNHNGYCQPEEMRTGGRRRSVAPVGSPAPDFCIFRNGTILLRGEP